MQFTINGYGGVDGGRTAVKSGILLKRGGWGQASDVRILFQHDPTRLGHPFCVKTMNKQGMRMLKIKRHICGHLLSYQNSS